MPAQLGPDWVANTTINETSWTTIMGTYTLPAGVDPATAQIYISSTDQTGPYTILIDDILITGPDSGPTMVTISQFRAYPQPAIIWAPTLVVVLFIGSLFIGYKRRRTKADNIL